MDVCRVAGFLPAGLLSIEFFIVEEGAGAVAFAILTTVGHDVVLDRVVIDKNARIGNGVRLVNEAGIEHADGDGYYIRSGIIVVPKNGVVKRGTVV